jgi:hypothetical protein
MTTRTCTTDDGTEWTCAQAYAGLEEMDGIDVDVAEAAQDGDTVTVVATPDGGAQTVRLQLHVDWHEGMSDEELVLAIVEARP